MFKRVVLAVAIMGMVSAPAMADMHGSLDQLPTHPSLQLLDPGHGTVGVLNTLGTFLSSDVLLYPNDSDIIVVTFGIHQPYATPLLVERNRNGITWDSTEVVVLGAGPAGPFVTNNIGNNPAAGAALLNSLVGATPNSSGIIGTVTVRGIEQFPLVPFRFEGSSTVPFFRVTFHAKGPFSSEGLLDLFMPPQGTAHTSMSGTGITQGVGLIFRTIQTTFFHTAFSGTDSNTFIGATLFIDGGPTSSPSFGIQLHPEPASAALLGIGALALTGGFWRRRRRQA